VLAWLSVGRRLEQDLITGAHLSATPRNLEVGPLSTVATSAGDFFELPITFVAEQPGTHRGTLTVVTNADIPDSIRIITESLHVYVDGQATAIALPLAGLGF